MKILFEGVAGSNLYGLETPDSDTDYKGVYLPTIDQYVTLDVQHQIKMDSNPDNKNTKEDVDLTFYSINEFVRLLTKGDFAAWDMIFTPPEKTIASSEIWEELVKMRKNLMWRDMSSADRFLKAVIKAKKVDNTQAAHAVRWAYQMIQLHKTMNLVWPLKAHEANLVRKIKNGDLPEEHIKKIAENIDKELSSAYASSIIPEKPRNEAVFEGWWLRNLLVEGGVL